MKDNSYLSEDLLNEIDGYMRQRRGLYYSVDESIDSSYMRDIQNFRIGFMKPNRKSVLFSEANSYVNVRKNSRTQSFNEVFQRFVKEKGYEDESDADLCKRANIRNDTLSRLRKEMVRNNARDILFALSVVLKLDVEETEELFESYGLSAKKGRKQSLEEYDRESAIWYFIKNKHFDLDLINDYLDRKGYKTLGQY